MEGLLVAIGVLLGAMTSAWRVLAEVRGMKLEQDRLALALKAQKDQIADVHKQTVNDHTSNFREDVDVVLSEVRGIAAGQVALAEGVERVEEAQRRHDKEIGRLADNLGKTGERLAQADYEDRAAAREEHKRIWDAIETINPKETS